jgi:hypothetical protein
VQIHVRAPVLFPGLWCNSSISACEADGPGANPGFLTIKLRLGLEAAFDCRLEAIQFVEGLVFTFKFQQGFEFRVYLGEVEFSVLSTSWVRRGSAQR